MFTRCPECNGFLGAVAPYGEPFKRCCATCKTIYDAIKVKGRLREPTVEVSVSLGEAKIRLDDAKRLDFWCEITLTVDVLEELLRQANGL